MNIDISEIVKSTLNEMVKDGSIKNFIKETLDYSIKELITTSVNTHSIKNTIKEVICEETRKAVGEVDITAHNEYTPNTLIDVFENIKSGIFK